MTTNPHPTPEERVEAALKEWRKDAGDLRVHFANAIREAEAAGEARGREACAAWHDSRAKSGTEFIESERARISSASEWERIAIEKAIRNAETSVRHHSEGALALRIRARTDKENSDD